MAVTFSIDASKDGANVTITYDLGVRVGGVELIADFQVYVDGDNVIQNFQPGQTRFNGTTFKKLSDPTKDVTVSYSISSNQAWTSSDSDVLRGSVAVDDVDFSG